MAIVTKKLRIRGRVQGVGYRYSMVEKAENAGVKGWVRNCEDGSVEAVVQGTADQVESVIDWARKGPMGARVESVDVSDFEGQFSNFSITHA